MTASGFLIAATLTFAGSVHCIGMCGPFVLATASGGAPRSRGRLALDQILLQLGKAATYASSERSPARWRPCAEEPARRRAAAPLTAAGSNAASTAPGLDAARGTAWR
jgi:hypothetical protein